MKTVVFRSECCKCRWGKYVVKQEPNSDSHFEEIDDKQLISLCEKAEQGDNKKE